MPPEDAPPPPRDRDRAAPEDGAADRPGDATLRLTPNSLARRLTSQINAPALTAGLVLAERFEIVRRVGRGGMGEVYEARDLELHETVALKTIRPSIAEDPKSLARFKREIQLARKVTHANVCRTFDLFHHRWPQRPGDDPQDGADTLTFLTMEFLAGETLDERIRREGPFTPEAALPIVEQMVAALSAAHAAGVVHRDFKSANALLVAPARPQDPPRVVITDFGLAQGAFAGSAAMTALTGFGDTLGTPSYMAPEQVTGATVTEAADIYALGIVLYEMVTGELPFGGDSPLSVAVKRLQEAPPSPTLRVANLDPRWEQTIMRCLERDPADRFPSVGEVLTSLSGGEVGEARREIEHRRRRLRRLAVAGAAAIAVVAAMVFAVNSGRLSLSPQPASSTPPVAGATVTPRRAVAVIGFRNLTARPETAWISTAVSEMLTAELSAGGELRAVSGDAVERVKQDLGLAAADAEAQTPEALARLRANLGADIVVAGSYLAQGGKIRLDARAHTAGDGDTIATATDTTDEADLLQLVSRTGAQLRTKLGLAKVSDADARAAQAYLPANTGATRLYSEGLVKLRRYENLAARGLLERAVAADPRHSLAYSALAAAWSALGYDGHARVAAKKAFDLSEHLSREDRYAVEARYHETMQAWDKAADAYGKLFGFYPDNVDYGLKLASVQTSGGKGRDALKTIDALRALPAPVKDDARIDLAEADAAAALSDFTRARTAGFAAAAKGTRQGAMLVVGRGRLAEGWALRHLGLRAEAATALEDARSTFVTAGDRGGVARALNYQGMLQKDQGYLDAARELFEQSLTIRRAIGDMGGVAASRSNIATIYWQRGQLPQARQMYEEALKAYRDVENRNGVAQTLQNVANVMVYQGDIAGARRLYDEALATYRDIGNRSGEAAVMNNVANVRLAAGDAAEAQRMFEQALKIHGEIGEKSGVARAQNNLGLALLQSGDASAATKRFSESAAAYREMGDREGQASALNNLGLGHEDLGNLGDAKKAFEDAAALNVTRPFALSAQSGLGRIQFYQGDLAAARRTGEQALAGWQQIGEKRAAAETRVLLARIALAEGRVADASAALADVRALPANALSRATGHAVRIAEARLAAASGRTAEAIGVLTKILASESATMGVPNQLDARLALGEAELRSSNATARTRLHAVERDAREKGFRLVTEKAAALRAVK